MVSSVLIFCIGFPIATIFIKTASFYETATGCPEPAAVALLKYTVLLFIAP